MESARRDRTQGWVATASQMSQCQAVAAMLVGKTIAAVRYVNIDYVGGNDPSLYDLPVELRAPRVITSSAEWAAPTWSREGFHAVDYGVEVQLADGDVVHVSWDPPGWTEGLRVIWAPLVGESVTYAGAPAVWDVSQQTPWSAMVGHEVTAFTLEYDLWAGEGDGFWCWRSKLSTAGGAVELILGDADSDGTLGPSSDCIAVVFPAS
jgi:hypothetical protein